MRFKTKLGAAVATVSVVAAGAWAAVGSANAVRNQDAVGSEKPASGSATDMAPYCLAAPTVRSAPPS